MERAAGLLNIFYNGGALPPADRQRAHNDLVALLRDPATADSAARFVQAVGASLSAGEPVQADPLVLHYALHALEERARGAAFAALPATAVRSSVALLVEFVVVAYAHNARAAAGGRAAGAAAPVAQHVIAKGARAAVAFGRREWAAAGAADAAFPRGVLALVDQNGHSAGSLPRMFAGITLLTVLVDDALDDPRAHMLAAEARALRRHLRAAADDVLAALEVGLRVAGPAFPERVPAAAARSVASVARLHPPLAPRAAATLRRCALARCDPVSVEILAVLADLFADGSAPLDREACAEALAHAAALLEGVAMGETAKGAEEGVCLYRLRLVAYAEAVARRVIGLGASVDALQRACNGLMGTTLRWGKESPDQFPAALDAWIGIFETLDDCEVEMSSQLLQTILTALSQLCVQRCMFSSNAKVLRALDDDDEEVDDSAGAAATEPGSAFNVETVRAILAWDDAAEAVDRVGSDATSVTTALMALASHGDEPEGATAGAYADGDGIGAVSRGQYVAKCVDTLVVLAQASVERVGHAAVEFAGKILSQVGMPASYSAHRSDPASARSEYICDLITATNIAYSVAQLLPVNSPASKALLEAVVTQLQSALQQPGSLPPSALFALLRTGALLSRVLHVQPDEGMDPPKKALGEALSAAAVGVLQLKTSVRVSTAATFVLLMLNKSCGSALYPSEPPFGAAFSGHNRQNRAVCALGATGIVGWTLGLSEVARSSSTRARRWSDDEKKLRTEKFSQGCFLIFKEFVEACRELKAGVTAGRLVEIARGAALLRTVVIAVIDQANQVKDVMWAGIGQDASSYCLEALVELKKHCSSSEHGNLQSRSEEERKCLFAAMSCLVGAVGCILRGCRRQAHRERPMLGTQTIQLSLEIVQGLGSPRLARVLLQLLLDQLVSSSGSDEGALVKASVDLASRALVDSDDADLGQTAVKVLTEVMSRFWLKFWPLDVAYSSLVRTNAEGTTNGGPADQETFFTALRGVLTAVRSRELETCQAGLLGLETLNASRKLYTREASFRACGAAEEALAAGLVVLGAGGDAGRRSLADEADSVVWGIASAELASFYKQALPKVVVEVGKCSMEDAQALCNNFGNATDRPSFIIALRALANDLAFLHARRASPAL